MNEPDNFSNDKSDVYSEGERQWMELGQRLRARMLHPLLVVLTRLKVTPDSITLLAGLIGLLFVPCWLTGYRWIALTCLALHVILDGVDGPLARHQKVDSARGSFTDTFTDQLIVTATTIAWMIGQPTTFHIATGAIYIFVYSILVAMAMVRNALKVPYSWIVRPRFFVYLALLIDTCCNSTFTVWIMLTCNILIALKCGSGFFVLRRNIPGPE